MLWIYSLELFLMSMVSWAWLTILLLMTSFPVLHIWAISTNMALSIAAMVAMATFYYTEQDQRSAHPYSYFFLVIFRGYLVDWFVFVYATATASTGSDVTSLLTGSSSMYAIGLGVTLAFMTFSLIIAFSLVVYSVDRDYPLLDVLTLNLFLTLAAGADNSVACDQTRTILICVYSGVYLALYCTSIVLPHHEGVFVIANILLTFGWFFYVFGVANMPILLCSLTILLLVGASELVLRYTGRSPQGQLTPGQITPRQGPPADLAPDLHDPDSAAPSAPPASDLAARSFTLVVPSMLHPLTQGGRLTHVGKKQY